MLAKIPPLILEPKDKSVIAVDQLQPTTELRWVARSNYENLVVEVAKDASLKEKVLQQTLDNKLNFTQLSIKESGTYFIRLTGFMKIKDRLEPVSSPIQRFQLQVGVNLIPPKLKSPLPRQTITYNQIVDTGLHLSWEPVLGIGDYKVHVEKEKSTEEVYSALKDAANEELAGILAFSEEPLVSIDFRGNSNSSIVDADNTKVIDGTCVKVLSWYDNEWGYSCRVRDLVKYIAGKGL